MSESLSPEHGYIAVFPGGGSMSEILNGESFAFHQ